jgi:hypothetical protein
MNSLVKKFAIIAAFAAPGILHAQFDFNVDGHPVQIHSFGSEGCAYSNNNNFLTMKTSQGSCAMTDGGVNASVRLSDKLRVGAQIYDSNVGLLNQWHPSLDWAFIDYRFKDWFGVRGGKVKTVLGLYNDTQDMEFLNTFALLPQGLYPLDLRDTTIAHTGGDIYGTFDLHKAGSISYTAYVGERSENTRGGYYYNTQDEGVPLTKLDAYVFGGDGRWTTPVSGLMAGVSWMDTQQSIAGILRAEYNLPYTGSSDPQYVTSVYADYTHGNWHFNAEMRRNHEYLDIAAAGSASLSNFSDNGWFVTGAYRVNKWLELGSYESRYYVVAPHTDDPNGNHIFDTVATARIDFTKWWHVKVEGHFMNGYGDIYSAHGFYIRSNPDGLKPNTDMIVVRTGFNL